MRRNTKRIVQWSMILFFVGVFIGLLLNYTMFDSCNGDIDKVEAMMEEFMSGEGTLAYAFKPNMTIEHAYQTYNAYGHMSRGMLKGTLDLICEVS